MVRVRLTYPLVGEPAAVHVEAEGSTRHEAAHNARVALADELGLVFCTEEHMKQADLEVLD